jgi:glucuronoarabinoxylan endo-1,4-beta-xylanase
MTGSPGTLSASMPLRRIIPVALLATLAALVPVAAGVSGTSDTRAGTTDVVVDLRATRQTIQGFGSSERVWSDPHLSKSPNTSVPVEVQATILTALYRTLGLTRVRPVLDSGVQRQPGGAFDFSGRFGDAHAAFVKQARAYGLKTVFPGPVYLEDWMKESDPGSYVAWAMAMLKRWRDNGVELELYAPLNEPKIARDFAPEWMRQVVRQLGEQMRAAGFRTKLVVPDDQNPVDGYRRAVAVLEDPIARQYVGALAYHIYKGGPADLVPMRQLATKYGLPVWMTEYGSKSYVDWDSSLDWAGRMHILLTVGGVNAVDYIWGFFGSWVRTDTMISIDFDNGQYRGFSYTPIYWITGQYSRFVRPGYVRVAATPVDTGSVMTSAYKGPGRAVVIATNPGNAPQTVRITVRGGKLKGFVRPVRSSASERWQTLPAIVPRKGSFTAVLPVRSITTFTVDRS